MDLSEVKKNPHLIYRSLSSDQWKQRLCSLWIIKDCLDLDNEEKASIAKSKVRDPHIQVAKFAWMILTDVFSSSFNDQMSVYCAEFVANDDLNLEVRREAFRCLEKIRTLSTKPNDLDSLRTHIDKIKENFKAIRDGSINNVEIDWIMVDSILKNGRTTR